MENELFVHTWMEAIPFAGMLFPIGEAAVSYGKEGQQLLERKGV